MSSIGCSLGNKHALLLVSAPCKTPFAAARRPPKQRICSCRAEEGANKKQNVKEQLGEDVMRRLKEAEEEANALRKQLAEAKEKAQVNGMQVVPGQKFPPLTALRVVHWCNSVEQYQAYNISAHWPVSASPSVPACDLRIYCMQASGDTSLLYDIEKQEEQTAKQISRITGTGMRREGLFGGGTPLKYIGPLHQRTFKALC